MPYVCTKWTLDTKKSPKRLGYVILEIPKEFLDLVEISDFVFNEINVNLHQQKISGYKKRDFEYREYFRYKKTANGQKVYIQRKDLHKQPFIAMRVPVFWRKKHIQSFFAKFTFKYWCKITWKESKEVVPANHENIELIALRSLPISASPAIVIL